VIVKTLPLNAHAEHTNLAFEGLNVQQKEVIANEFDKCVFKRCRFSETTFRKCRFLNCTFRNCDLNLMRVPGSSFIEAQFEDSKAIGVDWTEASWGFLSSIRFLRCTVNYSIFTDLDLRKARIEGCVAEEVDFRGANLTGVNLSYTDFIGSFFKHTVLEQADFTHAKNYKIDVNMNRLKGAKFMLPEAISLLYSLDIVLVE
jgi:fluoroquinolone resistance protein